MGGTLPVGAPGVLVAIFRVVDMGRKSWRLLLWAMTRPMPSPPVWIDIGTPLGSVEHAGLCALLPISASHAMEVVSNTCARIASGGVHAAGESDLPVTSYRPSDGPHIAIAARPPPKITRIPPSASEIPPAYRPRAVVPVYLSCDGDALHVPAAARRKGAHLLSGSSGDDECPVGMAARRVQDGARGTWRN